MADGSDPTAVATQKATTIATTIDHTKFFKQDANSVRIFPGLYDQYVNEVKVRALQLADCASASTEGSRPVNLKFCVDLENLCRKISNFG